MLKKPSGVALWVISIALLAVAVVACRAPLEKSGEKKPTDLDCSRLSLEDYDESWLRSVARSRGFRDFITIRVDSPELWTIPESQLTCFAMVESFAEEPSGMSWLRVWDIAVRRPNLESGIAVLNYMERENNTTWSAAGFGDIKNAGTNTPPGFEACLFAHIQDEQSQDSRYLPWNWIGDGWLTHDNHYLHCGRFLAKRSKPYMRKEWERLATFTRNTNLRDFAREILERTEQDDGAEEFSELVDRVREYRQSMLNKMWSCR